MAAASVTATATMAAAGFDKRSSTSTASSSLQTPGSGTFPSELRSPMMSSPGFVKQRESELKTPITPPSAYLDFLKVMSPAIASPAPTSTSARFSFHDKTSDKASESSCDKSDKPSASPPTSHPPLSRNASNESVTSATTSSTDRSTASSASVVSAASGARVRPESPRVTIPPSPFAKPAAKSGRTPRLRIPQSPFSPVPGSAHSVTSPYVSTPLSAAPWSASYERNVDPETNGQPGRVSVRQVVTRTVTYCRTPLEPAPNGNLWKRRKIDLDDSGSKAPPPKRQIKEETQEDTGADADAALAAPAAAASDSNTA